ncbi:MutS-related protein [Streptococcus porci]|uniref:MutS-related protein n=1 Tax=Streptococcus porci TaxID=502567 RepID=UPI0004146172|nr:hypothetical protein [Streptococcus porci]
MKIVGLVLFAIFCLILFIFLMTRLEKKKLREKVERDWRLGQVSGKTYDTLASLEESLEQDSHLLDADYLLDQQTWSDLDLQSLFEEMNLTYSSLGTEYLFTKLHYLKADPLDQEFQDFQEFFRKNPELRVRVQEIFYQLGKQNNHGIKAPHQHIPYQKRKLFISLVQGLLPVLSLIIVPFNQKLAIALFGVAFFLNIMTYTLQKSKLEFEMARYSYLVRVLGTAQLLAKMDLPHFESVRAILGRYGGILRSKGLMTRSGNVSEMDFIYDYLNGLFMIPFIVYQVFLKKLQRGYEDLLVLYRLLSALEASISLVRYLQNLDYYCRPRVTEDGACQGEEVYHPLVRKAVSNPIRFDQNLLLVGDNASGKSTYIKMVALNLVLAQSLNFVTAKSFSYQPGPVYTSLNLADLLLENQSYFMSECQSVKRMIEASQRGHLVYLFLDELFKGTNTKDRLSIAVSLLEWLNQKQVRYLVSTHDIELLDLTRDYNKIYHFQSNYQQGKLSFDYLLREGDFRKTNAIEVLQDFDFPQAILDRSRELRRSSFLDETGHN